MSHAVEYDSSFDLIRKDGYYIARLERRAIVVKSVEGRCIDISTGLYVHPSMLTTVLIDTRKETLSEAYALYKSNYAPASQSPQSRW